MLLEPLSVTVTVTRTVRLRASLIITASGKSLMIITMICLNPAQAHRVRQRPLLTDGHPVTLTVGAWARAAAGRAGSHVQVPLSTLLTQPRSGLPVFKFRFRVRGRSGSPGR